MSRFPMNRYDEQRLIQEVQYLHSLWHQGPPRPHHHPPIPTHPTPIPTPVSLQPTSSTQFKKRKKKSKRLKEEAIIDSGVEWPCPSPAKSPPVTESGWGSFTPQPNLQTHLPTAEELANFASNQAHQKALKTVSEYLKYSIDAEDDDDDDDDDDSDDEKGEKNYNFFAKLFAEDGVLREYYEKNCESGGEFSCLVCCGVGKKGWKKKFKDCVALVQHSVTIANTNTRQAHRAYGQVICKILGWDINRLPSIVLSAGDKPSVSSDKPAEAQVLGSQLQTSSWADWKDNSNKTLQGNEDGGGKVGLSGLSNTTDNVKILSDESSQQKQSFSNENQQENGGNSTALEKSPMEASVSDGIPETAKKNTEDASNYPGASRSARRKANKRRLVVEMAKIKKKNTVAESGLGNEDDGSKDGLIGISNTTDTIHTGIDDLSQQKQSSSNENQQESGGGSTALEHNSPMEASVSDGIPERAKENTESASNCPGNESDGGKNELSGQSNTSDTVNIGSNELSQQKESFGNENQQENVGESTVLESNSMSEDNANRSLEDVSNDIPETEKENAEGASNCPEPLPDDMIVANEENNTQKDDVPKETTIVSDKS